MTTTKPPGYYEPAKMVFIGGIPHDMKNADFMDEVNRWPGIVW